MRMEDLDTPRVSQQYVDQALFDLEWLGLDWDGDALLQSRGLERLRTATQSLVDAELVYACVCSRKEVRLAQSAPHAGAETRYPGTCRERFASLGAAEATTGREAGLRFKACDETVAFYDGVAGEIECNVQQQAGDFIIARRNGIPAYQLAVVVDDAQAEVSEVVRGDDLLASTARQILLQRALGLNTPRYYHLPLVTDPAGQRLAKRQHALGLNELRGIGVDPRAIVQWVATSAGIAGTELPSAEQCIPLFQMQRLPKNPVSVSDDIRSAFRRR